MLMPHPSSSGLQKIRRELQRRKHKAALAPTRPAFKKTSAPLPREEARDKCLERRPRISPEMYPYSTASRPSGSAATHSPPRPRRPRPSSATSAPPATPPPPPSRPVVSWSVASPETPSHMNPGDMVLVRTRTQMVIDGRTLVLWLPATMISATDDGGYEVIYEGNLPRDDHCSTVRVPLHHVRPIKPSPSPPLTQPSSGAAGLCASATAAPRNQGSPPAPQPTTAGKSLRILHKLATEMKPAPRPTTAGKSIHVFRRIMAEKERQAQDSCCLGY